MAMIFYAPNVQIATTSAGLHVTCPEKSQVSIYASASKNLEYTLLSTNLIRNELFSLGLPIGAWIKVAAPEGSTITLLNGSATPVSLTAI